jgi:hypothetical protein
VQSAGLGGRGLLVGLAWALRMQGATAGDGMQVRFDIIRSCIGLLAAGNIPPLNVPHRILQEVELSADGAPVPTPLSIPLSGGTARPLARARNPDPGNGPPPEGQVRVQEHGITST